MCKLCKTVFVNRVIRLSNAECPEKTVCLAGQGEEIPSELLLLQKLPTPVPPVQQLGLYCEPLLLCAFPRIPSPVAKLLHDAVGAV